MAKWLAGLSLIIICGLCYVATSVYADPPLKSNHFEIDESVLDGGGLTQENSASYQASESIGDLGINDAASTNFQIKSGYTTTNDPALAFAITQPNAAFTSSFSPSTAAVATSTFLVSDYTSYGYAVQIIGNPPSNGSYTLAAMSTTGPSQAGIEQFGINLVANTSPVSVGANPNNGLFGFGAASTNYGTSNQYRFVSGETIAAAPKSSGITNYTISYIVNVTDLTLGGQYTSNQTLICTGTY